MFQSFDPPSHANPPAARLSDLRKTMQAQGLDWYLLPHGDEQQNEYLPPNAERLAWLTGFSGSAGFALIGRERAHLFVDGRYTLQASRQADTTAFAIENLIGDPARLDDGTLVVRFRRPDRSRLMTKPASPDPAVEWQINVSGHSARPVRTCRTYPACKPTGQS